MTVDLDRFRKSMEWTRTKEERFGDAVAELERLATLRPLSELTEEDGEVLLWWCVEGAPPKIRGTTCAGWGHTDPRWRWTPLPKVHP